MQLSCRSLVPAAQCSNAHDFGSFRLSMNRWHQVNVTAQSSTLSSPHRTVSSCRAPSRSGNTREALTLKHTHSPAPKLPENRSLHKRSQLEHRPLVPVSITTVSLAARFATRPHLPISMSVYSYTTRGHWSLHDISLSAVLSYANVQCPNSSIPWTISLACWLWRIPATTRECLLRKWGSKLWQISW